MLHLATEYWVLALVAVFLLTFYACLWVAGRESEQESRFEAQWDLEHEASDPSESQVQDVHTMEAKFHARPTF